MWRIINKNKEYYTGLEGDKMWSKDGSIVKYFNAKKLNIKIQKLSKIMEVRAS